ncbi:MAG: HAD hydrolase family protein [Candidatus Sungbacteria bacterium]|nr:HAD hydrolase family protein [Candidatus Sungbacteria bacterium]
MSLGGVINYQRQMRENVLRKLVPVRLVAFDFDGIMTDGMVYVDDTGHEMVRCSRRDSLGVGMLQKQAGIVVGVISKEANPVVAKRCEKIKVQCWQGVENGEGKLKILKRIAAENNVSPEEILYMGDDVNDIEPMQFAGVKVTVADGHKKLKAIADYVTEARGGSHAVREVCELILEAKCIEPKV